MPFCSQSDLASTKNLSILSFKAIIPFWVVWICLHKLLNLIPSGVSETKGCCGEDISEGKRTLMVIYTLKKATDEDSKRLIEILNMHTNDQTLRDEAIAILKKYDSLEYSKGFARKLVTESWKEVDGLLESSDAKDKLRAFANFLIERDI